MHYQTPAIDTFSPSLLEALAGPVQTQYITDLQAPDRVPSQGSGAGFEFCFEYTSEGCEGGGIHYRMIPLGGSKAEAAMMNSIKAVEGQNCVETGNSCGVYTLEVWVECDGEPTNVLSQRIQICDVI